MIQRELFYPDQVLICFQILYFGRKRPKTAPLQSVFGSIGFETK